LSQGGRFISHARDRSSSSIASALNLMKNAHQSSIHQIQPGSSALLKDQASIQQ